MRYQLRQKIWSWGDDFTITDDQGREVYQVDGRAWSWGDKLSLRDMRGNELAFIAQKLLSWGPTYEIYRDGREIATVKKAHFTLFHDRFRIDVPGPDDFEAEGDFLDHEYVFLRGGREVARVSKRWWSWSDTYGVEIAEGEDAVLILATAVVIDLVNDKKDDD